MISQVVRQIFLPRIRQTFPIGSVREPPSASPRSQQEQPFPPAQLCQWPSQHSHPGAQRSHPRVAEGPQRQPQHTGPDQTHVCPTPAKHFWECFLAVPFSPSQVALAEVSPRQWLCSGVFLLCLVSRSSCSIQCHHHIRFPTLLINPCPKESSSSSTHRAL